ncbi:hemerythrin domain-containing protein [Ideonella sp. DXS29W]|uniref:Hemerythrin domain-containing protein n=1 Tax=Ideonella lacteola TaxID=2984193 RepID=A0ABU9BRU3_9BURK
MPTLTWSDELALAHTQMDATHEEFVALLGAAEAALAQSHLAGLEAFQALVDHTDGHFSQEDRWMAATGFSPENCHTFQHTQVLGLMREVARVAREGADFGPLERLLPELAAWFPIHAQSMDAALAAHLQNVGYDTATGAIARPPVSQGMTGCGGASCSPASAPAPAETATSV